MSVLERELRNKILQIYYYNTNQNIDYTFKERAIGICQNIEQIIFGSLVDTMKSISFDVLVEIAEACYSVNTPNTIELSENILKIYFEYDATPISSTQSQINKNNFYIRALLVKAQIESRLSDTNNLKGEEAIACLKTASIYIQKALEIIARPENKIKYAFLTYNTSIIAFNLLKNYFKPNWSKNFLDIVEKLSQMLEDSDDVDYNWRLRFLIKLAQNYLDAEKKVEAGKSLDKITELLKKKGESNFQEELFRFRVFLSRENTSALAGLKKEAETTVSMPQLKYIHTLQCIKCGIINENALEKEAQSIIVAIYPEYFKIVNTPSKNSGNIGDSYINMELVCKIDPWKADILAELAYILSKYKLFTILAVANTLYHFLLACRSNTLKGKLFLENIKAVLNIHKLEVEIKKNSFKDSDNLQKRIHTRADSIKILERNLSGCISLADFDLINETCMLIFNLSIPFFKKNFRKYFIKAFDSSVDILEQINSNESQLRATLHFELAKGYLEEDLLQDADTHLTKALTLDYSIPQTKLQPMFNFKITEQNTNISYLQRNLEQFLVYLKRNVRVRLNIYQEPENAIDKLMVEAENIRNSKYEEIKVQTIEKCVAIINNFSLNEFNPDSFVNPLNKEKHLVDEEIVQLKTKHDLKIYEDKKHFTLVAMEIQKLALDLMLYEGVLIIHEKLSSYQKEWNTVKDVDQILSLAESNLLCAKCYEEFLANDGVEVGSQEILFFRSQYGVTKDSAVNYSMTPMAGNISPADKERYNKFKQNFLMHIKESIRLAVSVSQFWFIFNCATTLWNAYFPIISSPNFLTICNEMILPILSDIFEGLNSGMIYYESINSEAYDTEIYNKLDIFVNITSIYSKLLEIKGKQDESIRVCDVMLTRNMNSNQRKIFDTIKARAAIVAGKKLTTANKSSNITKGKQGAVNINSFIPSQDQILISDSFQNLESAVNTKEEKAKIDLLKKGIESLKNVKINLNDEATLELNAELWYKYGIQFFLLNNYANFKLALFCADKCVKSFNDYSEIFSANENSSNFTSCENLYKWYAVGFLLYGDCIDKLVDKDRHERSAQIKLFFTAMEKIVTSAKIAEKCKQYYVIKQCVKAFYSIVIKVVDQPQNRESLVKHFIDLHNILINNRAGYSTLYTDPEFLLLFYSIFCMCLNESKQWELGEKVVTESLKIIPASFHNFLLEHKLFYYSKLGKNFIQNLIQGDTATQNDKETLSRAKLLTKLARSSTDKKDQFNAYTKAIEMLKNDSNIYVTDVLFELATWLYQNNYPSEEIEDTLNEAVDIIVEIESAFDEEDAADDGNSLMSNRSASSRHSRISKRSKSKTISKISESKRRSSLVGTSKLNSKELHSNSRKSIRTRNYSNKDTRTRTVFAKILDFEPYPLYMNISHCEQLIKLHVFLSIVTQDVKKKREYLLDAFMFLIKILEISFKTLNCLEFYDKNKEEIKKQPFAVEVNTVSSLILNYFTTKELNVPQFYNVPENFESWILWDFPEIFNKKITEENSYVKNLISNSNNTLHNNPQASYIPLPNFTFFSKKSFEKPNQLFFYLRHMVDKFTNEFLFHTQAIPLLKFCIIFSEHVLENKDLKFMFALKLRRLYHNILMNTTTDNNILVTNVLKDIDSYLANPLKMTTDKRNRFREELQKFDMNMNSLFTEDKLKIDNFNQFSSIQGLNNEIYADNFAVVLIENMKEHVVWTELAEEYFNYGYYNFAKEYLDESIFHSLILKDKSNFIKANYILAKIYIVEANFESGFGILNKIQSINCDIEVMFEIVIGIIRILESLNKNDELLLFTEGLIEYLNKLINENKKGKNENLNKNEKIEKFSKNSKFDKNEKDSIEKLRNKRNSKFSNSTITTNTPITKSNSLNKILSIAIISQCRAKLYRLIYSDEVTNSKKLNHILTYYKDIILPDMKKYDKIVYGENHQSIYNIFSLFKFIEILLDILQQTNFFTYITSDQLSLITQEILEKSLDYLTKSVNFLVDMQILVPGRTDTNLYSLTIHRLIGIIKIKHACINNIIGELSDKMKREIETGGAINNSTTEDATNRKKVKQNQQVVELLNSLTKEIERINWETEKEDPNSNRYEKSIGMLTSTDSLIPVNSCEYFSCLVERINSYRLQAMQKRELIEIWDEDLLKKNQSLQSNDLYNQGNVGNGNQVINNIDTIDNSISKNRFKIETFHQMALNLISEFEKSLQTNNNLTFYTNSSPKDLLKFYLNNVELSGYLNIELSFKSLCEYQNQLTKSYFFKVIDRYLDPKCRDWVSMTSMLTSKKNFSFSFELLNSISYSESINNYIKFVSDLPYIKYIFEKRINSWNEVKSIMPINSSYFIFQMNEDRTILYIGFMYYVSNQSYTNQVGYGNKSSSISNYQDKKFDYFLKRILVSSETNKKIDNMLDLIKKMKHVLVKSSILTNEEMRKLYDEYNKGVINILNELETGLGLEVIFNQINTIVNPVVNIEDISNRNSNPIANNANIQDKNKKNISAPEKSRKADNKTKDNAVNENIQTPTSNIESITLLIDQRFYELPFDQLGVFIKIPYKSYDFSIDCVISRLKMASSISNISGLNNNNNNLPVLNTSQISNSSAIKYFFDYSMNMPMKTDLKKLFDYKISTSLNTITTSKNKENSSENIKLEGVISADHQPSLYELQKLFSNSGIFFFTSQTSFLYQFPPYELLDISKFSKCRIAIVLDRIATIKKFVNQKSLITKNFNLESMPLDLIAILTLTGVNTILTNKWSLDYDEVTELISDILDESGRGIPLSYCINKYRNPKPIAVKDVANSTNQPSEEKKKIGSNRKENEKKSIMMEDLNNNMTPGQSMNIPKISKMEIFQFAPVLFGLNNLNLK